MIDYINFCIGTAALTISTLGLLQVLISRHFEKTVKAFFILFFSMMVGCAFFSVTDQYLSMYRGPIYARLARITLFWESLLPAVIILLLTAFLLYSCGEPDWRRSRVFHVTAVTGAVYCGLLIYTQFSTQIYSIDENNIYQRGPYYPLLLVPAIFIMVVNVIVLWKRRSSLSRKQRIAFWVYTVVPTVSMLIQTELGLGSRVTAEQIKKYPMGKVESLFHMRLENGSMQFFQESIDPRYFGHVVLHAPGEMLKIEEDIPMERILEVRRDAKKKVFVKN